MAGFIPAIFKRRRRDVTPSRQDYLAEELRRRRRRTTAACATADAVAGDAPGALVLRPPSALEPPHQAEGPAEAAAPYELRRGIEPAVLKLLTPQLAREFGVLPVRVDGGAVVLALAQEPTLKLQNELRWLLALGSDRPLRPVFERVPASLLAQCLDVYYPHAGDAALLPPPAELFRLFARAGSAEGGSEVLRPGQQARATVRGLVEGILLKAVYRGASDILFECFESEFRVRYKVEGECEYAMTPLPPSAAPQVVSIVKQHARLDIAETERSQDGRFDVKVEHGGAVKSIQFRVAIRPTINGEGCVIRLHDNSERRPSLESVGADARTLEALHRVRDHRGGLVVFCGPTGSGKTTTLAAILGECDSARENIITIEDPVEIRLPGVTQSAVNELKGETFARMLKTTLRVAPDRILVGEVRDAETAHLVIKASLTGHQVLTTVHSEDAPKAVTRLLEEGVSAFNLSSVLFLVVAQRLLNRLCDHCAVETSYPAEVLEREQFAPFELEAVRAREARGCSMCHQRGTYGRVAIFETLVVTDEIRELLARRPHDMESLVRRAAILGGMRPLRRCGLDLAKCGVVSLQQVADATPYIASDALPHTWRAARAADERLDSEREAWDWVRPLEIGEGEEAGGAAGQAGAAAPPGGARGVVRGETFTIVVGDDADRRFDGEGDRFVRFAGAAAAAGDAAAGFDFELLEALADHVGGEARASLAGFEE